MGFLGKRRNMMKLRKWVSLGSVLLFNLCAVGAGEAWAGTFKAHDGAIADQFIVIMNDRANEAVAVDSTEMLARAYGGRLLRRYHHAVQGFAVTMRRTQAMALSADPRVDLVEENVVAHPSGTQTQAPWALDRIDQRYTPMDGSYSYGTTGFGVNAYIVDSGIRLDHAEFTGRAQLAVDFVGDGYNGWDCYGHGTKVAGLVGGVTYGVAKQVNIFSVRVADCSGVATLDRVIAAFDWLTYRHVKPAVVNLSYNFWTSNGTSNCALWGPVSALDSAARGMLQAGITLVNSAGNCGAPVNSSPALASWDVIVAGASTFSSGDRRVNGTAYGYEVDAYAPGWYLQTASHLTSSATTYFYYTSAAAGVTTGVISRYLQANPSATPTQVNNYINTTATPGIVLDVPTSDSMARKLLYANPQQ